jgi:hypothetical protein
VRGEHLLYGPESPASKLARHRVRAVELRVDHPDQPHRLALLLKFLVDAGMVASKNAHAHHRDEDRIFSLQGLTLDGQLPRTPARNK